VLKFLCGGLGLGFALYILDSMTASVQFGQEHYLAGLMVLFLYRVVMPHLD